MMGPMKERSAVWQFALSGLVGVLVIGLVAVLAFRVIARQQALEQAKDVTRLTAAAVVEPALTPNLIRGDPRAIARFDSLMRDGVLTESDIVRVKLWTPDGRIVYSDEPRLIGRRYGLDEDELKALRTDHVEAEVSDLSDPENRFERGRGELLEVYLPAHLPNGRPLLFESYRSTASIAGNTRDLTRAFIPALIGGLIMLQLLNLPLARRLVGRVRRAQRERETYLQAAMTASDRERRRIAADLHDGVVQDMNGLSLSMAAESRAARARGESESASRLDEMAGAGRQMTRGLRNALVDIYPPTLHREGLGRALDDLAESVARRGIDVEMTVEEGLKLEPDAEALLFRIGRETMRNVVSHAAAKHAQVSVRRENGVVSMTVRDDGRGFAVPDPSETPPADGHLGLRALQALTEDAGGTFQVESSPGNGAKVRAELPD